MPQPDVSAVKRKIDKLMGDVDQISTMLGEQPVEDPRPAVLNILRSILAIFDRCRSTFAGVRVLLRGDLVHESVILARPLFTDSLVLAELASANETRRADLVVRLILNGINDFENITQEAAANGDDVTDEREWIERQRQEVRAFVAREGLRVPKSWPPAEKTLAFRHGRRDELLDFRMTHWFVHGSGLVLLQRYTREGEGVVRVGGKAVALEPWRLGTAIFASTSMLYATRAALVIIEREEPPALAAMLDYIDELAVAQHET
jgi:hypothetical protein